MIKAIKEKTGAEIDINDDGTVFLTGKNGSAEKARQVIEAMTREYKKGEKFQGTVVKITDFGAFVRIGPNTEGLVHVSEIANFRIDKVSDAVKIGEKVPVVIKEIDEKHRINLSIKQADPEWANKKGLKPVDVYTALEINKVVFYQTIRSSNLNNKTLHKILKYLDLEIEVLLHEKQI